MRGINIKHLSCWAAWSLCTNCYVLWSDFSQHGDHHFHSPERAFLSLNNDLEINYFTVTDGKGILHCYIQWDIKNIVVSDCVPDESKGMSGRVCSGKVLEIKTAHQPRVMIAWRLEKHTCDQKMCPIQLSDPLWNYEQGRQWEVHSHL